MVSSASNEPSTLLRPVRLSAVAVRGRAHPSALGRKRARPRNFGDFDLVCLVAGPKRCCGLVNAIDTPVEMRRESSSDFGQWPPGYAAGRAASMWLQSDKAAA